MVYFGFFSGVDLNLDLRHPADFDQAYVLVAIVKKRLNLSASLYEILQILSLTLFEKMPINQLFAIDHLQVNMWTDKDEIQNTFKNQGFLF